MEIDGPLKAMCKVNGVSLEAGTEYLYSLMRHINFVREAGRKIGVPENQLVCHDESKFTEWEFPHYARKFHGANDDPEGFARAWLHHENSNPHHWGYWIPRSGKYAGQPLEMQHYYALEMVADWMGANMAYQNTWDMTEWLNENFMKIRLHPNTRLGVANILNEIGYLVSYDVVAGTCDIRMMGGMA